MALDYRCCCRSRMSDDTMMKIPEDLWPDILKRLPVKKLLEVRSVCKSWKALVSSSAFVEIHRRHHIMNNNTSTRLQLCEDYIDISCAFHHQDTNTFTPLEFPQIPPYDLIHWSNAVVHGVALLHYDSNEEYVVALWNPAIRKHVVIPWLMIPHPCDHPRLEGFGFDPQNNDFKVVRSHMEGYYDIFSVRDGVWRMNRPVAGTLLLGSTTCPLRSCHLTGCFLNRTLHWITTAATDKVLHDLEHRPYGFLLFDCVHEEFTTMDLPPQLVLDLNTVPRLFILDLGGLSLLALVVYLPVGPDDICELWTYGGSWTKLRISAAVAAGDADILFNDFMLTPLAAEPNQVYARFKYTRFHCKASYVFQETMLLMDVGMPDQ